MTTAHAVLLALGISWIFTAAVLTMPTPGSNASEFYKWAFGFLHLLAGAVPRIVATFFPQYAKFFNATDPNLAEKCDVIAEEKKQ